MSLDNQCLQRRSLNLSLILLKLFVLSAWASKSRQGNLSTDAGASAERCGVWQHFLASHPRNPCFAFTFSAPDVQSSQEAASMKDWLFCERADSKYLYSFGCNALQRIQARPLPLCHVRLRATIRSTGSDMHRTCMPLDVSDVVLRLITRLVFQEAISVT